MVVSVSIFSASATVAAQHTSWTRHGASSFQSLALESVALPIRKLMSSTITCARPPRTSINIHGILADLSDIEFLLELLWRTNDLESSQSLQPNTPGSDVNLTDLVIPFQDMIARLFCRLGQQFSTTRAALREVRDQSVRFGIATSGEDWIAAQASALVRQQEKKRRKSCVRVGRWVGSMYNDKAHSATIPSMSSESLAPPGAPVGCSCRPA